MRQLIIPIALLSAAALLLAQAPPLPSELQSLRLLSAYQHVVIDQQTVAASEQALNSLAEATRREMNLPEGSTFAIDLQKQKVAVRLPDKPPATSSAPAPPKPATIPPEAKPK